VAFHEGLGGCSLLKKRKTDRQQEGIKKAGSDKVALPFFEAFRWIGEVTRQKTWQCLSSGTKDS